MWACEVTEHGREHWQSKVAHLMLAKKHKKKKGQGQDMPLKCMPLATTSSN
jgi:hypothetical protein